MYLPLERRTNLYPILNQIIDRRHPPFLRAYPDEAGHAFQSEAGHLFQHEAGQDFDLMSATPCLLPQVVGDDVLSAGSGQVSVYFEGLDFDGDPRFRRLSPLRSSR